MSDDGSGISLTVMLIGIAIAAAPYFLPRLGFSFTVISKIFFGIYGLTVLIGGAYKGGGEMNYFVDIAAVTGLILIPLGSLLDYPIGANTWHWLIIGLTFLLAVPSTALVIITRKNN